MNELSIARLIAGGEGLGFIDGKAVFVPGVLPGERVRVRVVQRRRDYNRAVLVDVLEASVHRVVPGCRYAGHCGGCDWLHIDYEEQLRQKVSIVAEALRRTGRIEREDPRIEPSAPWQARNRAQVHRAPEGGIGYMGARSIRVLRVDDCPIVLPAIGRLFRGETLPPDGLERFTVFADGEMLAVEGRDDSRDLAVKVDGRDILFSVGCFFQANIGTLQKLVPWALGGLEGGTAVDLYSGVGLFAAFLAEKFSRIICVESRAMSLSYAMRNVPGPSHEFYPMTVEQWIRTASASSRPDAVIVDPPRAGLGPEVRTWLTERAPRRLVYVSCNPVTLARDLAGLTGGGFVLDDLRLFDFYPQTSHVEAVAKLTHRGGQS
ncbi:MAG: TRAM domain-containing protein [Spirochaetia bacterium]